MQTSRRISQIVSLIIFFTLFVFTSFPLIRSIPVNLFLCLDPLAMLSAGIAGRFVIFKMIPALFVILITIFMGRFFCGWICPLGTTLDATDKWNKAEPNNSKFKGLNTYKYILLIIVFISMLFSVQIASWVDPIPLFTRIIATVFYPIFAYVLKGFIGLFYSIIFLEEFIFNLEEILKGRILLATSTVFQGMLFNLFIFTILIGLSFLQKRFWCRSLCPLGALLGIFSKLRLYRRSVSDKCTQCGLCYQNCRTGAIRTDFMHTNHSECINCMDCVEDCPVNAITFGFNKKVQNNKIDLSRRQFVGGALTGFFTFGLVKSSFNNKVEKSKIVRPPGALKEDQFFDRCLRCGECVRVCSTSGRGLQLSGLAAGLEGLGTPLLLTPNGYCKYTCNACGDVCPTGAIQSLALREKKSIKIGTAHFNRNSCIPWYDGKSCNICHNHCPVTDKAIKLINKKIVNTDGSTRILQLPYVDEELCIGCGVCTTVCPVTGEKGIYLTNKGEIRSKI